MNVNIERFHTPEFRDALRKVLTLPSEPMPAKFRLKSVIAFSADGRSRLLREAVSGTGLRYSAMFCEGEHLVAVGVEFADGSSERIPIDFTLPQGETLELFFNLEF